MMFRSTALTMLPLLLASFHPEAASAQSVANADAAATRVDTADFFTGIWRRPTLLGDMGGLRNALGAVGVTVGLTEATDFHGNASGGLKQGATVGGLATLTLQLDTQKAFGWDGGLFNISALQIHGRSLSPYYVGSLQTSSGIEATSTTRLWEVWYQQSLPDTRFDVKLGQQSIDQEFMASTGSALFVNTMMGWPMVPSADLYAGGPAYPLSSLGVRLRAQSLGPVTLLGGVFQDNPPGGAFANDGQLRGTTRWGGNFNLRTGALFIAEAQYAINQPVAGEMDDGSKPTGLPGTYKIGAWFDTAGFPSQTIDTAGVSLASANSTGNPKLLRQNYSLYGVADQMVWRPDADAPQAVGVFARVMGAPGDRNLISFSLNAGITLKAPLPGRDDDTFGIGYGLAKISNGATNFDRATALTVAGYPVRSNEQFIEVTYQAQVTPWLQVQPDVQYVIAPGGGVLNPNNPAKKIGDAVIFGVRTNITF